MLLANSLYGQALSVSLPCEAHAVSRALGVGARMECGSGGADASPADAADAAAAVERDALRAFHNFESSRAHCYHDAERQHLLGVLEAVRAVPCLALPCLALPWVGYPSATQPPFRGS